MFARPPPLAAGHASTSAIRATPSTAAFTTTRILLVVTVVKFSFFQTRLLLVIVSPETAVQALPSQYCPVNPVTPSLANVCSVDGSAFGGDSSRIDWQSVVR